MASRHIAALLFLSIILVAAGCSDDDCATCPTPENPGPLEAWAGTYDTDTKFGGAAGTWNPSADMTITADGEIYYGATRVLNPVVDGNMVSWSTADGNDHNVTITFATEMTSEYFWDDLGGSANGRLFTGSRQSGSEGPLDFRGVIHQLAWVGSYETATKFGGAAGTWNASAILDVTASGSFIYGEKLIINPSVDRNSVSWSTADGNDHNVQITFTTSQTSDYYWADIGGSASGKLFTGSRQSGSSGPLDFRGLVPVE